MYMNRHKLLQLFADEETYDRVFPIIRKAVGKSEWPWTIFVWLGPSSAPIHLDKRRKKPKALLTITMQIGTHHVRRQLQKNNILIDCAFFSIAGEHGDALYFTAEEMCEKALLEEEKDRRR